MAYQCWDRGSRLEKAIDNSTGDGRCELVDRIPSD